MLGFILTIIVILYLVFFVPWVEIGRSLVKHNLVVHAVLFLLGFIILIAIKQYL